MNGRLKYWLAGLLVAVLGWGGSTLWARTEENARAWGALAVQQSAVAAQVEALERSVELLRLDVKAGDARNREDFAEVKRALRDARLGPR